eukprot:scaffold38990_cov26-Tisochrysis_lutea.AAC.2
MASSGFCSPAPGESSPVSMVMLTRVVRPRHEARWGSSLRLSPHALMNSERSSRRSMARRLAVLEGVRPAWPVTSGSDARCQLCGSAATASAAELATRSSQSRRSA